MTRLEHKTVEKEDGSLVAVVVGRAVRKTGAFIRGREIVVELLPGFMKLRLAGQRSASSYEVSYEGAYYHGAKVRADRLRAEKAASRAKKGRRKK